MRSNNAGRGPKASLNADFHVRRENNQRFTTEKPRISEKTGLGTGETLIVFRQLLPHFNIVLFVDEMK